MADEVGGKEFVDLIGQTDSSTGKSIGETILGIVSGETKVREGFGAYEGSKRRDISETLARGRGFLGPVGQASDQELDKMMAEGTGLEVLRGADKQSLEDLTNKNSINTPQSAYNDGGDGTYFAIEAASDEQIKDLKIRDENSQSQFTSDYYAKQVEREGREAGVMRAIVPSSAKVGTSNTEEYKKSIATTFEKIETDLNEMEKTGQDVSHARSVLSAIKKYDNTAVQEGSPGDVLAGYDAVVVSGNNEIRLINRPVALSSGVKSREEIKQMYPETSSVSRAEDIKSGKLTGFTVGARRLP